VEEELSGTRGKSQERGAWAEKKAHFGTSSAAAFSRPRSALAALSSLGLTGDVDGAAAASAPFSLASYPRAVIYQAKQRARSGRCEKIRVVHSRPPREGSRVKRAPAASSPCSTGSSGASRGE
jgi:hypothetical protein